MFLPMGKRSLFGGCSILPDKIFTTQFNDFSIFSQCLFFFFFLIHQVRCQVSDLYHSFIVYYNLVLPTWYQVSLADVYRIINASLLRAIYIATAAPSPPYDITCLESFRDSMVLGWKQPDMTGGAEITGYYVNYREVIGGVPGKWREANIKAVSDAAYKVGMPISVV